MSVDVSTTIEINRPRTEVAAYSADPLNAPQWYVNIKRADWTGEAVLAVGNGVAFIAQFMGRRLEYSYLIRELVTGHRLVMSTEHGPFPMETTYEWTDTPDGGTRMTLRNRGEPAGFARIAAPVMERAMRRANEKDLARLKAVLER